jgi:hypothetical protein
VKTSLVFIVEIAYNLEIFFEKGRVAQLVEQRIENPCVGGSSPPSTTIHKVFTILSLPFSE